MALSYETRVATIARALNTFLRQFKLPDHLDQETAVQRIRMTADAINKRLPNSLHPADLEARLSEAFVKVLETTKGKEWPAVEAFVSAVSPAPKHEKRDGGAERGDRSSLSADQLRLLEGKVIPAARRWLDMPGLAEHGKKTLEFWGEEA